MIRLQPDSRPGASRLSCAQSKGDNTRAVADYAKVIELDPRDEEAWRGRGLAHLDARSWDAALADLTQAITLNDRDALAYHFRSQAYAAKNDLHHAVADDSAAIRLDPRLAQRANAERPWQVVVSRGCRASDLMGSPTAAAGRRIQMSSHINRRGCLGAALAVAATTPARAEEPTLALGNRAHFLARPEHREALTQCFSKVLGCSEPVVLPTKDPAGPILAFRFPGGGAVSVQFSDSALDEAVARRGAWLELRSADPAALEAAVLAAGLPQIRYAATTTFYFAAPGGQVFGIARQDRAELKS